MEKEEFKIISDKEAAVLEKIADATKMDAWFRIDENLHVYDGEGDLAGDSEAELVCLLEDGLAYGLDEPQCGNLTEEEEAIARACFKRARIRWLNDRIESLEATLKKLEAANKDPNLIADVISEIHNTKAWLAKEKGPKWKRVYSVPVVYKMHTTVTVEADSAEEAYDKVREHPEDFNLLEEDHYVEGSFRVADDNRENAIATIRELGFDEYRDYAAENEAASGRHTNVTVGATVIFQRWEGDTAYFNGSATFDACDVLDSMDDDEIAQLERGEPYALDNVYFIAVRLGRLCSYDGPFEVELDEDAFAHYLEVRKEGE